jgi:hypothetical protein
LLLCSSHLLLGFPTGRSFTSSPPRQAVVAAASGLGAELGEVGREGQRPHSGATCLFGGQQWQAQRLLVGAMENLAGVECKMGWRGGLCLPRGAGAICLLKSNVAGGDCAPNRLMAPRDLHESANYFIGLQNAPASFGGLLL